MCLCMLVMALLSAESIFLIHLFNQHKSGDRHFGGCLSLIESWLTLVDITVVLADSACVLAACVPGCHLSISSPANPDCDDCMTDRAVTDLLIMSNTEYVCPGSFTLPAMSLL